MTEYFPNLAKDIKRQIQQVEQTPNKINPKKFNPRYTTIIKLLKTKDKQKILKAAREKQHMYKEN